MTNLSESIWTVRGMYFFLSNIWTPRIFIFPFMASMVTGICHYFQFSVEMHVAASIFFVGVFVSFGIVMNTADERRFKAFEEIATIKANLMSIVQISKYRGEDTHKKVVENIQNIFPALANFLEEQDKELSKQKLVKIDIEIRKLQQVVEILRNTNLPSPELSRIHQWIYQINLSFEKLIIIKEHRTPLSLRLFLKFALGLSVFILAPEFAIFGYWGIIVSAIIGFLLISLISIQNIIEEPFKGKIDNVKFDFTKHFVSRIKSEN